MSHQISSAPETPAIVSEPFGVRMHAPTVRDVRTHTTSPWICLNLGHAIIVWCARPVRGGACRRELLRFRNHREIKSYNIHWTSHNTDVTLDRNRHPKCKCACVNDPRCAPKTAAHRTHKCQPKQIGKYGIGIENLNSASCNDTYGNQDPAASVSHRTKKDYSTGCACTNTSLRSTIDHAARNRIAQDHQVGAHVSHIVPCVRLSEYSATATAAEIMRVHRSDHYNENSNQPPNAVPHTNATDCKLSCRKRDVQHGSSRTIARWHASSEMAVCI